MLDAVPEAQLEVIIARTTVAPKYRKAFLGAAAAVMLVALSAAPGCEKTEMTKGISPKRPEESRPKESEDTR